MHIHMLARKKRKILENCGRRKAMHGRGLIVMLTERKFDVSLLLVEVAILQANTGTNASDAQQNFLSIQMPYVRMTII
jgi:hypothetical protein